MLADLLLLPQFRRWKENDVIDAIEHSLSNIDHVTPRFEHVDVEGRTYVRARYGHTFAVVCGTFFLDFVCFYFFTHISMCIRTRAHHLRL